MPLARINLQLKILLYELRITANSPSLVCCPLLRVRWRARASANPRINWCKFWLQSAHLPITNPWSPSLPTNCSSLNTSGPVCHCMVPKWSLSILTKARLYSLIKDLAYLSVPLSLLPLGYWVGPALIALISASCLVEFPRTCPLPFCCMGRW